MTTWSPLYLDYITHYGNTSDLRRASVCKVGDSWELSKWWKGCGFNPQTQWYDSIEEAKEAGELWTEKGFD